MKATLISCLLLLANITCAQLRTENVIIVTLDGFRWQELFTGADPRLLFNTKYCSSEEIRNKFWDSSVVRRRENLLPFFWKVIATQGQLYGNRQFNNRVNCSNPHWFSYPGYSELFTGMVDKRIRSNDTITNPNYTVLEFINREEAYRGRVAAFSTWDAIPFVIRAPDAGIHARCAKELRHFALDSTGEILSLTLRQMFGDSLDADDDFATFYSAFDYLKNEQPKVIYISLDGTDSHGHGGDYDKYLRSAYATDRMIADLWNWVQTNENYKDKTTLLLTTDHGRGRRPERWKKHGRLVFGSGQMWFAVIGPDTPAHGEIKSNSQYYQKQFAKTVAYFLGLDYSNIKEVGARIYGMTVPTNVATRD